MVVFWGMLIEPWLVLTLCRLLRPFLRDSTRLNPDRARDVRFARFRGPLGVPRRRYPRLEDGLPRLTRLTPKKGALGLRPGSQVDT